MFSTQLQCRSNLLRLSNGWVPANQRLKGAERMPPFIRIVRSRRTRPMCRRYNPGTPELCAVDMADGVNECWRWGALLPMLSNRAPSSESSLPRVRPAA